MGIGPDFASLLDQLRAAHAREIGSLQQQVCSLEQRLQGGQCNGQRFPHDVSDETAETALPDETCEQHSDSDREDRDDHRPRRRSQRSGGTGEISIPSNTPSEPLAIVARSSVRRPSVQSVQSIGALSVTSAKKVTLAEKLSLAQGDTSMTLTTEARGTWQRVVALPSRAVASLSFERFFLALTVLNACLIAVEMQTEGFTVGEDIGFYPGQTDLASRSKYRVSRGAIVFCSVLFFLETSAKIASGVFLLDWMNLVDFLVIILDFVNTVALDLDILANVSLLRMCRLVRTGWLYRLLIGLPGVDALYLMTTALKGSAGILFWASLLLVLVQTSMAICINQYLFVTFFQDHSHTLKARQDVFEYFGTFTRAMLSMFEITLANWPPACRLLAENVSEWFMLLCVIYKLTIGFAVVAVINGVFMKETFKVADTDDIIMMKQSEKQAALHAMKMKMLFEETDLNGDGEIDIDEFRKVVGSPAISAWLTSQGICCDDVEKLFQVLDCQSSEDGTISYDELLQGIARLRGNAKSMDLLNLMHDYEKRNKQLVDERKQVAEMVARQQSRSPKIQECLECQRRAASAHARDTWDGPLPDEASISGNFLAAIRRTALTHA